MKINVQLELDTENERAMLAVEEFVEIIEQIREHTEHERERVSTYES